ncbi:MAG TPA: ion channel [Polyangiaceae bacterium]
MSTLVNSGMAALVLSGVQGNGLDVSWTSLKTALRDGVARDPLDALAVTVLGGSFLFYVAEKDHNPKVTTYWDALVYVSTCLSVGYADVFARTKEGKAIATAIMAVGPALAAKALDPAGGLPVDEKAALVQQSIADKLDAILVELRAQREAAAK